jgi:hypothetical protein
MFSSSSLYPPPLRTPPPQPLHSTQNPDLALAHKVLTCIEYRAVSGVCRTIDPPPPLPLASVSSPRTKCGGGGTHSPGGEGVGVNISEDATLDWPLTV